jgi:hypothetical protein
MTLLEVVERLDELDDESTIYASRPWSCDSVAVLGFEPEEGGLPGSAAALGASYFLEVFVAKEFLADWIASGNRRPTPRERCERLIRYATTDA